MFRPGEISDALREALGIGPSDIPEWIYRMRRRGFIDGYPPGYLAEVIKFAYFSVFSVIFLFPHRV